jgi:hypothetical protein
MARPRCDTPALDYVFFFWEQMDKHPVQQERASKYKKKAKGTRGEPNPTPMEPIQSSKK